MRKRCLGSNLGPVTPQSLALPTELFVLTLQHFFNSFIVIFVFSILTSLSLTLEMLFEQVIHGF